MRGFIIQTKKQKMLKKLLICVCTGFIFTTASAQVHDVSVIVAPTAGYNWFDNKSTVEDGVMYGLQAGFGFGKVVELRGIYETSVDLKQNFGNYQDEIEDIIPGFNFKSRSIKVTRIGGEFKTNIPARGFAPYILLGSGVQKLERELSDEEDYKSENLYVSGGLGIKLNIGARTTLNFEGRGIAYNMNPNSLLYNEGGSSQFDDWINNQKSGRMYNWSLQAALQFYLGGRAEDNLNSIEKSFLNRFSGGLSKTKLTLAPAGAYVNFNSNSGYRNTYMAGGILGLDFTNFVGLRAYYYQATENEELSLEFDKLGMYGVDFIGNLNVARGIVPYITIGGGYLDVQDGYTGKNIGTATAPIYQETNSGYYVKGGAGLTVPLGKYVDVFGAANVFYTIGNEEVDAGDLKNLDQLKEHTMFNVGLRLKLGRKAQTENAVNEVYNERFENERNTYEQRINTLQEELNEAFMNNDSAKAVTIIKEKQAMETKQKTTVDTLIRLTPTELESLIEKTVKTIEGEESKSDMEKRLDRMEQLLINLNEEKYMNNLRPKNYDAQQNYDAQPRTYGTPKNQPPVMRQTDTVPVKQNDAVTQLLVDEINKLKQELRQQNSTIESLQNQQQELKNNRNNNNDRENNSDKIIVVPGRNSNEFNDIPDRNLGYNRNQQGGPVTSELSFFLGPSFGDASTFNAGVRLNYPIGSTRIYFMPELYAALGKTNGFGLNANAVYPFKINHPRFTPYAGIGAGINSVGSEVHFNTNVILGTSYQLTNGNLFADYTIRGAFINNQIALGYRFRF